MDKDPRTPSPAQASPAEEGRPRLPPSAHSRTQFQSFIQEAIEVTNPPMRHLATPSLSSLGSHGRRPSDMLSMKTRASTRRPLSTNLEEQRHPGNATASFSRTTKPFIPEDREADSVFSSAKDWKRNRTSVGTGSHLLGSDDVTLCSNTTGRTKGTGLCAKCKQAEVDERPPPELPVDEPSQETLVGEEVKTEEEDETKYPGPLGLFILITGIALSIFLISLDRTIITTVSVPVPSSRIFLT